jgi:hypothetical protein
MSDFERQLLIGAAGGFVAALITSAISLLAVWWSLANQRKEATAQDKRNLRDARSARTRRSLGTLLAIALKLELAADEPILMDKAMQAKQGELLEKIDVAVWVMLDARAEILSEPDGLHWVSEFQTLVLAPWRDCRQVVADMAYDKRGATIAALKAGVATFQAAVSAHLAKLDQPI